MASVTNFAVIKAENMNFYWQYFYNAKNCDKHIERAMKSQLNKRMDFFKNRYWLSSNWDSLYSPIENFTKKKCVWQWLQGTYPGITFKTFSFTNTATATFLMSQCSGSIPWTLLIFTSNKNITSDIGKSPILISPDETIDVLSNFLEKLIKIELYPYSI